MFKEEEASVDKVPLKIGICGIPGAGKTVSSLLLAYGITKDWSKIVVADTEDRRASLNAKRNIVTFNKEGKPTKVIIPKFPVINMPFDEKGERIQKPFHPNRFQDLIEYVEKSKKYEVLIIDSFSDEYVGEGGINNIIHSMGDDSFGKNTKKVIPLHDNLIKKIIDSPLHIILTYRLETEYATVDVTTAGKRVKRLGMRPVTKDNKLEFPLNFVFKIEDDGTAIIEKESCAGAFSKDTPPFKITPYFGSVLKKWSDSPNTFQEEEIIN